MGIQLGALDTQLGAQPFGSEQLQHNMPVLRLSLASNFS